MCTSTTLLFLILSQAAQLDAAGRRVTTAQYTTAQLRGRCILGNPSDNMVYKELWWAESSNPTVCYQFDVTTLINSSWAFGGDAQSPSYEEHRRIHAVSKSDGPCDVTHPFQGDLQIFPGRVIYYELVVPITPSTGLLHFDNNLELASGEILKIVGSLTPRLPYCGIPMASIGSKLPYRAPDGYGCRITQARPSYLVRIPLAADGSDRLGSIAGFVSESSSRYHEGYSIVSAEGADFYYDLLHWVALGPGEGLSTKIGGTADQNRAPPAMLVLYSDDPSARPTRARIEGGVWFGDTAYSINTGWIKITSECPSE